MATDAAGMRMRTLGRFGPVSALTLGGGGLGQVWGRTTRAEAVATVHRAVEAGITLLDLAPIYGDAEEVVGEAFGGDLPPGVRLLTKCRLGNPPPEQVYDKLSASLDGSLIRLRRRFVDLFLIHGTIDAAPLPVQDPPPTGVPLRTSLSLYRRAVIPALQRLVDEGRIGGWGINAIQLPPGIFDEGPRPTVAQCIANLMGTPGGPVPYDPAVPMRHLIETVAGAGIGVMGIRAVQAGALVDLPDRQLDPMEARDFERAAGFRALAAELGLSAAMLAHRYALSIPDVGTVVLGVKNRDELEECLAAQAAGPLAPHVIGQIDATVSTEHGRGSWASSTSTVI